MNYKKVSLPLILLLAASLAMAEVGGEVKKVSGQAAGGTAQKEVVTSTSTVKAKKKKAVKKAVKKQKGQKTEQQPKTEGSQTK
jgi:hypothetical protein